MTYHVQTRSTYTDLPAWVTVKVAMGERAAHRLAAILATPRSETRVVAL